MPSFINAIPQQHRLLGIGNPPCGMKETNKQESTQAAENNSLPPFCAAAEAEMHEVYYQMGLRQWQKSFQVGLAHMTPLSRIMWFVLLLLIPMSSLINLWLAHYPLTWPLTQLPPLPPLFQIRLHLVANLCGYVIGAVLVGCSSQLRTVQVTPNFLVSRKWGLSQRTRWRNVTAVHDTDDYICFCRNLPAAITIPKTAFRNDTKANAFFETALTYWHSAKAGRTPLNVPAQDGVWPPAPRPSA